MFYTDVKLGLPHWEMKWDESFREQGAEKDILA